MATHSSILAWRTPMDRGVWQTTVHGVTESQIQLSNQIQNSTELTLVLISPSITLSFLLASCKALPLDF